MEANFCDEPIYVKPMGAAQMSKLAIKANKMDWSKVMARKTLVIK
jgi:hypothetical protein